MLKNQSIFWSARQKEILLSVKGLSYTKLPGKQRKQQGFAMKLEINIELRNGFIFKHRHNERKSLFKVGYSLPCSVCLKWPNLFESKVNKPSVLPIYLKFFAQNQLLIALIPDDLNTIISTLM